MTLPGLDIAIVGLKFAGRHWLALVFLAVAVRLIYFRFFHPLAKVPGPFLASLSRHWLLYHALISARMHLDIVKLHEKYGPVVRVAPDAVHIGDPEHFYEYYTFDRSEWWLCMNVKPGQMSMGWCRDMKEHNARKKKVAPAFTMSNIQANEDAMDDRIRELISLLDTKHAQTGDVVDMADVTQWTALDVVMEMVFGQAHGFLKEGRDVGDIAGSLYGIQAVAQIFGTYPIIMKFLHLPFINPYIAPQETDLKGPGALVGLPTTEVNKRFVGKGNQRGKDCLTRMMEWRDSNDKPMSKEDLIAECIGPVLAGPDTTACSERVAILYLSTHADIRAKLLAELDEADAAGKLSNPVRYEEVKRLPYFDAVIKEVFRIHPAVGNAMWRRVPKGGKMWNDHFLPGGTEIGVNPWVLSRNKALYGPDVDIFRPERWLEDNGQNELREKADIYFGGAYAKCLGMNIALLEVYKIVAELFLNFEITVTNPVQPWNYVNWVVFLHDSFYCKLKPRVRTRGAVQMNGHAH